MVVCLEREREIMSCLGKYGKKTQMKENERKGEKNNVCKQKNMKRQRQKRIRERDGLCICDVGFQKREK